MKSDLNCPADCHGQGCSFCFTNCQFAVAPDNDQYFQTRGDVIAGSYNDAYRGWEYRVQSEGYEPVQKDAMNFAKRLVNRYEIEVRRAERRKIADELDKYVQELLASRGISNPTWVGKNELGEFLKGLRS